VKRRVEIQRIKGLNDQVHHYYHDVTADALCYAQYEYVEQTESYVSVHTRTVTYTYPMHTIIRVAVYDLGDDPSLANREGE
jgi:hypothetical protein